MREQDVERIAAEVLAALREGAPAGADRPAGRGIPGGRALSRPPGGEASRKRRIPGCPRLRTRAGTGTVRFPIWRGRNSAGGVSSLHPIVVTSLMISFRTPGRASPPGLWGRGPRRGPACVSLRIMPARRGRSLKKYLKNGSAGMACGAFPRWRRTRIPTSRGPTSGGCCPRSRCGS